MEVFITDFGVQPVYLAAQIVNFLILLLILKRFMYKPILKVLEERKTMVSNNLIKSEELENQLQNIKNESNIKLSIATKEAQLILDKATRTANLIIKEAHQKAEADIQVMLKKGEKALIQERDNMKQELREQLAKLVVMGTAKVAGKIIVESDHKKIVSQAIDDLKKDMF